MPFVLEENQGLPRPLCQQQRKGEVVLGLHRSLDIKLLKAETKRDQRREKGGKEPAKSY